MNFRNALITLCLGSAACGASALSLGHARGVVVLGRPVDLAFDVHTDPGQSLEDACIRADLVSGANAVPSGRVHVTPLPTLPGRPPAVRVQSTFLADEPVLTVTLHVGCSGKTSRTYTFLADLPETVVASARPVAIPVAVPAETVPAGAQATAPAASSAGAPASRRSAGALPVLAPDEAAAPRRRPERAKAPKPAEPVAVPAPRPKPEAPVARKGGRPSDAARLKDAAPSRLVMEPLENWLESPSQLRMTPELALPATTATEQQRAQAQAEWQALNMRPEDLLKEGARMATLNTELAQVRAQAEKDRAATLQLLERLEKEKSERYSGTLVYLLLGLLVVVAAWAAWMATRLRAVTLQAQEAWAGAVAQQSSVEAGDDDDDDWQPSVRQDTVAPPLQAPETGPATVSPPPEPPVVPATPAPQAPAPVAAPTPVAPVAPPPSAALLQAAQPALLINPEELFDLQQQAEFFVSVGEHSQAIGVLKKYIADNEATAPAAYLELLRLYRSLSRVDDFNQLRAQFHEHFNAQVPEFAAFNRPGRSLLSSPDVLAEVEALWSDESVVPLLDSLLFRGAETALERFDLAAYDDLLLLNAIARTTPPSARGAPPPRQRTTPLVSEEDIPAPVAAPAVQTGDRPAGEDVNLLDNGDNLLDAGDSMLDYDPDWLLETPKGQAGPKAEPVSPAVADEPGLSFPLDFDLSDPFTDEPVPLPPITQSDLPPVPPSQGPASGQVVGFGANSDRFEARHDPEARKPN